MSRVVALCFSLSLVAQMTGQGPAIEAARGTFFFGLTPQFAVSPDGQSVVFVAHAQGQPPSLWVRGRRRGHAAPAGGH